MKVLLELASWYFSLYTALVLVDVVARRLGYGAPKIRSLIVELKPLYWPAAMAFLVEQFGRSDIMLWVKALDVFGVVVYWWLLKRGSDDDDRWKKRRKKLAEKVSVVGGRLAVTPA